MYRIVKHPWGFHVVKEPVSEYGALTEHFASRKQAMEWLIDQFTAGRI